MTPGPAWTRPTGVHISGCGPTWCAAPSPATSPRPASLLAFTAWQDGNGALANLALDRALADQPDYSMALLLRDILDAGTPPSAAVPPMTPEQVADSYAAPTSPGTDDSQSASTGQQRPEGSAPDTSSGR